MLTFRAFLGVFMADLREDLGLRAENFLVFLGGVLLVFVLLVAGVFAFLPRDLLDFLPGDFLGPVNS